MPYLTHVGLDGYVSASEIVAVASPTSASIVRIIREHRAKERIFDLTFGKKTKSVILTKSDFVILSSLNPETISGRIEGVGK